MGKEPKTKKQLTDEVNELRRRIAELETFQSAGKRPEEQPEEFKQELYRSLFEMCPDAIVVVDMKGTVPC